jgi:heme/copper-type cytochrome/quinol oxidase subunit 2
MGEIVGLHSRTTGQSWAVRTLYAVLLLSALALVTLFVGDILAVFEDAAEHEEHDHFFLFDLAWPVFVVSFLVTIVAAVVAFVVGRVRRSARLRRFGAVAAVYCVAAIAAVVLAEAAGL